MPTNFNNRRRIESLEFERQQVESLITATDFAGERLPGKRTTYLAETCDHPDGSTPYPETGDTFHIRFVDISWNPTAGESGFEIKPRSDKAQAVAKSVNGKVIKKKTLCFAVYQPPPVGTTGKGKWIITPFKSKEYEFAFFELKEDLVCGEKAEAYRLLWDKTLGDWVHGDVFYVQDEYGDLHGKTEYRGWAAKRELKESEDQEEEDPESPGEGEEEEIETWSIIYWDHQAIFIEFTLTADMEQGNDGLEATATLTDYYQGQPPELDGNDELTVYDTQGFFKHMKEGDKGKAVWSQCAQKYIVWSAKSNGAEIQQFVLTEKLTCGSFATAMNVEGTEFLVEDVFGDRHGIPGAVGWAIKVSESDEDPWALIVVDHQAIFLEVTLSSSFGSGASANAMIDTFYQGMEPPDSQQGLEVYDSQLFFPLAISGAKAKAVWSQCEEHYIVYECQQMARKLTAELFSKMCPDDSSGIVTNATLADSSPFNLIPLDLPDVFANPYGLAGKPGDKVWIELDGEERIYKIIQVQHHKAKLLTKIRYSDQDCKLEAKYQEAAISTCEEETEWETLIQLQSQAYITDISLAQTLADEYNQVEGSCRLEAKYSTVCGFGTPEVSDSYPVVYFEKQEVLIDVGIVGDALKQYFVDVFVPCVGDGGNVEIVKLTDCEEDEYGYQESPGDGDDDGGEI